MKKLLCLSAVLAWVPAASASSSFTTDLSPSTISVTQNSSGISSSDVFNYTDGSWYGTYENGSLIGQVGVSGSTLNLSIGAASSGAGNFAGLHFELPTDAESATLSFSISKASSWGDNISSFTYTYTCTVYGFDSEGNAAEIGTWTYSGSAGEDYSAVVSITLSVGGETSYTSYGLIFNSKDTSSLSSAAGVWMSISNITVSGSVPEPATATLGLLALGALALRRRRA